MTSAEEAWAWLEDRGVPVEKAAEMGFGAGVLYGRPRISIPYIRDGKLYCKKYRGADSNEDKGIFCKPKDEKKSLFNIDALKRNTEREKADRHPVIIAEGEFDAVSCILAGWETSVSVPDGWDKRFAENIMDDPGERMRPLIEAEDDIRAARYVIVAADSDEVGAAMIKAMSAFLEGCDIRAPEWPSDCKDANDVLVKHGASALTRCLMAAKRVDPPGCVITGLSDMPPMEPRRILRTGQRVLDRMAAFEVGALSVSTGVPGHGKTTFATFIADQLRRNERVRIGLACFETHPHRIREQISLIDGYQWSELPEDRRKVLDRWYRVVHRSEFDGADDAHDMLWVRNMIRSLAIRDQCSFIVIDPWNELDHMPPENMTVTQYINLALTRLRQWANLYGTHLHVIAHPTKLRGESGAYQPPSGYDISDSAAWYNKPALGYTVHVANEDGLPVTKVITWKVRDRETYDIQPGVIKLDFDQRRMIYRERI